MTLNYSVKRQVTVGMVDYIKLMVSSFPPESLKEPKVAAPWSENLFKVSENIPSLITKHV